MMMSRRTAELGGAKKGDEEGVKMPRHFLAASLVKTEDGEQRRDGEQKPLSVAPDDVVPVHERPLSPIYRGIMPEAGKWGTEFSEKL